ncbi:enoyl-CoA hydratase-related protein [Antrihabitans sp. YC2-6]|uniref:enoyl-CoA hydratase-related protein n=1 Tax=Antrihabitans sp. YC2-6 TaxID=2799498 RepID=UPI0018F2CE0F|nr:enoyl-CoA hydratase-related protein [Antrihabitans sp. YC2-6]MBJ8345202.1 enoyl-CoA hydratase/isomerase family protein [Antrihabitans sp. YC2-6]
MVQPSTSIDAGLGIRTDVSNRVLRVTIDRPDRRNALSRSDFESIAEVLQSTREMADVAVLTGGGEFFCAGADLSTVSDLSDDDVAALMDAAEAAVRAIRDFPGPVIAAINGPAVGIGVSLAVACDLTVAARSAYFLLAFTRIGLMPDGGATATIPAAVGRAQAMRMALLGDRVGAAEAVRIGLINRMCDDDVLDVRVDELLAHLATGSVAAFRYTKHAINAATLGELEAAFARERTGQLSLAASPEFQAGVAAFRTRGN